MPAEYIKLVVIIGFVVLKVESWPNPLVEMLDFIHDTNDRTEFDTPKFETPSEEEIFATKEDKYYSIYERSRLQPKILSTNVIYRIKSLNDSRPSGKSRQLGILKMPACSVQGDNLKKF